MHKHRDGQEDGEKTLHGLGMAKWQYSRDVNYFTGPGPNWQDWPLERVLKFAFCPKDERILQSQGVRSRHIDLYVDGALRSDWWILAVRRRNWGFKTRSKDWCIPSGSWLGSGLTIDACRLGRRFE